MTQHHLNLHSEDEPINEKDKVSPQLNMRCLSVPFSK